MLYNPADPSLGGLASDNFVVPGIHLDAAEGAALVAFANAHADITAAFTTGKPGGTKPDVLASFSSRGGSALALGILKPDIAAPGVQVLAGDTPQGFLEEHAHGILFAALQGTSMASPHVAGAAALLRDLHPDWTPGQIKSALMTTAFTKKLFKEDQATPFAPFDAGAGRVQVKPAINPGATFDATAQDYRDHAADLWNVNHPSVFLPSAAPNAVTVQRTLHSELAKDSVWKLSVTTQPGLAVNVPPEIALPAGGDTTFAIGLDKSALGASAIANATLTLKGKGQVTVN